MKRKLALMVMCIALLTGCCGTIRSGVIVDKQHMPAVTTFIPMRVNNSMVLIPVNHPERYCIVIEGKAKDGQKATRTIDVAKEEWQGLSVGDDWKESGR